MATIIQRKNSFRKNMDFNIWYIEAKNYIFLLETTPIQPLTIGQFKQDYNRQHFSPNLV